MTPQQAKELLPIITAFANGETIEMFNCAHNEWVEFAKYNFDLDPKNYRIKPKTKIINVRVLTYYNDGVAVSLANLTWSQSKLYEEAGYILIGEHTHTVEVPVNN